MKLSEEKFDEEFYKSDLSNFYTRNIVYDLYDEIKTFFTRTFDPSTIIVNFTGNSMFFTIKDFNYRIHLECFIERDSFSETPTDEELIYTIFNNNSKLIESDHGNLEYVFF